MQVLHQQCVRYHLFSFHISEILDNNLKVFLTHNHMVFFNFMFEHMVSYSISFDTVLYVSSSFHDIVIFTSPIHGSLYDAPDHAG